MDAQEIINLLELSIELELGVGALYELFAELYPEDRAFWAQLHIEEKSHASLLRTALDSFTKRGVLPDKLLTASVENLRTTREKISMLIDQCKTAAPSRREAFRWAIDLENESGEQHYNQFMAKEPASMLEEVFQQLNRQDKDHKERIETYFDSLGDSV